MASMLKTELVNFNELTRDTGTSRSGDLARHVATLFAVTSERCSDEQVDIYDGVLTRLVDMVELEVRQFVAKKLAHLRRGPEGTMRKLARDEISVADPVLSASPVLRDADLIEIVEEKGDLHRIAIARREVLSEQVTDGLVGRGGSMVKQVLSRNEGAVISEVSMMHLIAEAAGDENLQEALSDRNDLAEHQIRQLVAVARQEVRNKLMQRGATDDAERLDEAADIATRRLTSEYWLSRYDFETARGRVMALVKDGQVNENTLRKFASEDRFPEAVVTLSWIVGSSVGEMSHWMVGLDTTPFLLVAKAAGLSSVTVSTLLGIGPWRNRLNADQRAQSMRSYGNLTASEARARLAYWNQMVSN
ncbi:MAG: DUF2336 domain-containing protein [Rhodobacteraceae bacterium]|nr:DUF2336 domain-containing protein [Paracoccaceae bacterium]